MKKILKSILFSLALLIAAGIAAGALEAEASAASVSAPTKVKITSAKAISAGKNIITWKKAKKAKGYQVYRKLGSAKWKKVGATKAISFTDAKAKGGKTYSYKVRAYRTYKKGKKTKYKYGKFSAVKKVKTIASIGAMPANKLSMVTLRSAMLSQINAKRRAAGLPKLKAYTELDNLAQIKAKDMYKKDDLNHYSSTLGWFSDQLIGANIATKSAGENIAAGQSTVNAVMTSWMNSPGHKANILDSSFTHVGIGYYKGYWVQLFAEDPVTSFIITCPTCGREDWAIAMEADMTSKDENGNVLNYLYCYKCGSWYPLCPRCKKDVLADAGINNGGLICAKCSTCGYQDRKVCISNCPSCGNRLLGNTEHEDIRVIMAADNYSRRFIIEYVYCKSCQKIILFTDNDVRAYRALFKELAASLPEDENVYDHITWEKDGITYPAPQTSNLSDLVGQNRLL